MMVEIGNKLNRIAYHFCDNFDFKKKTRSFSMKKKHNGNIHKIKWRSKNNKLQSNFISLCFQNIELIEPLKLLFIEKLFMTNLCKT